MRVSKGAAALLLQQLCKKSRLSQLFKNFHGPNTAHLEAYVKYGLNFTPPPFEAEYYPGQKSGTTIRELYWLTTYFGVQGYKASMRCRQRRRGASSPGKKKRQRPPLRYSSSDNSITVEVK